MLFKLCLIRLRIQRKFWSFRKKRREDGYSKQQTFCYESFISLINKDSNLIQIVKIADIIYIGFTDIKILIEIYNTNCIFKYKDVESYREVMFDIQTAKFFLDKTNEKLLGIIKKNTAEF